MGETLFFIWLTGSVVPLFVGRFDVAAFVFGSPLLLGFAGAVLFIGAVLVGIPIFIVYVMLMVLFG